nr:hypothetical protein [Kofleriaceae bacterium]
MISLLAACGGGHAATDAAPPLDAALAGFTQPDLVCPGSPQCASAGDGVLKVGAGKHVYSPTDFETYTDENGDHQWETTEPYTDLNHNGTFDGVWLFGGARAAMVVNDDVEARALAFVEGDTTVVILYVDCIGLLAGDDDIIRNDPRLASLNIDHIVIGATHAHDAPDTVGLWGPNAVTTGRQPFILQALYDASVAAITDAVMSAQPANMTIASTLLINDPNDPMSKTDLWNQDIRDPIIFDPTLTIARFTPVGDPSTTIGTLVNWADHPEVAHFSSTEPASVTAHYVHWLRQGIENGVGSADSIYAPTDLPGLGGITVFVQGALGGQIGSIHDTMTPGPGGVPITQLSHAMDQAIGTNAAARALTALAGSGDSVSDLPLSMVSATFAARMDNVLLQTAFLVKILAPHDAVGYDPTTALGDTNAPWLPLRSTYVQIGPLGIVTVPGELHPELWVGGYDGSWSWGWPIMDATKPNAPNLAAAPAPPYMRDLVLAHDGVKYPVVAGLAEDYIGYIVPSYNYVLDPDNPYIVEAEGDHYEEVYSLGPDVEAHAIHPILDMLAWRPQ